MSEKIYLTPGPSQLYPQVDQFVQDMLKEDVCSISHRSQAFQKIYKNTVDGLKSLLNIPDNYHVFFTGSASEIWDKIITNIVSESSFHFVNGSFSKKFFQYSQESGKKALKVEVPFGKGFDIQSVSIPQDIELICFTHNETSSGVSTPLDDMYHIRKSHPHAIIAVDVVSSLPHPNIDYSKIDTAFFSVQKCFGLPAGLGVWIVNDRCIEKANQLKQSGKIIGAHLSLPELLKQGLENQTPSTPNVLGIYLLGRVLEKMLSKGIDQIRKETSLKASLLYEYISSSSTFSISVDNPEHRSETVIVANSPYPASEINKTLSTVNMAIGSGYGPHKNDQIRIANFPAISVESVKLLIETLKAAYK